MFNEDDDVIIKDNVNYKSISFENIPEIFLDKLIAKKHFGKFGKINKFILRPNRLSCTVDYENENDAKNALLNAGVYNGFEFKTLYTELEETHVRNTEEWVDSDVQAELDSMRNLVPRQRLQQSSTTSASFKLQNIKSHPKPILKSKPVDSGDIQKIDGSLKAELELILNKPAVTIEDRYRILDARDKLIRLKTVRTTDIRKVISTIGICPDMCPEKERLLRETRNQVSIFELGFNGMDHNIAVKEYSRSSADQETPLAHELRPEPVLKMTMNYLLHNIMDLCENDEINLGDWYHFVWDRTRSIRKDITQQDLCSLESVNLVEQCARFHIHCAARLIAEDVSVFDQKINTENLTKCLQSLKYMYHDLRLKNIKCPNESEFRAYIILLNLNDTNFLWEVKQLPNEIQNSKQIQEAISFYISTESNNYVKFFKLINNTSYMNACILFRYFHQVRNRALQTILKAYNFSKTVFLPISYLTNILAFEKEEDAITFFNFYNLECFNNKVKIDKNAYDVPDEPYYMERSLKIVEGKRIVSIGEVICGKSLDPPTFEDHQIHCSFDQNGFLKLNAWKAEDQGSKLNQTTHNKTTKINIDVTDNIFKIPSVTPPISPKHYQQKLPFNLSSNITNNEKKLIGAGFKSNENLIKEQSFKNKNIPDSLRGNLYKNQAQSKTIKSSFLFDSTEKQDTQINLNIYDSDQQNKNIFNQSNIFLSDKIVDQSTKTGDQPKSIDNDVFGKPSTAIQLKQPIIITVEKKDFKTYYNDFSNFDEKDKNFEKELEDNKEKADQQNKLKIEIERKQKIDEINKISLEIFDLILNEVQNEELQNVVESELQKYININQNSVVFMVDVMDEIIQENIKQIINEEINYFKKNLEIIRKYFIQWKRKAMRNIQRQKLIDSVSTWTQPQTIDKFANKVAHPALEECLQEMKRYRLGRPKNFNLNLENKFIDIDLFSILSDTVNLNQVLTNGLLKYSIYLKFILSIPGELDEINGFKSYLNKFLNESIVQSKSMLKNSKSFFCSNNKNLSICLRKISGVVPKNELNKNITTECDNANGMIFVMSSVDMDSSRRRLHHILKLSLLFNKPIPLAIMVYKPNFSISIIDDLKLHDIYDDFNFVKIFHCNEITLPNAFIDCLKFLGNNIDNLCELEMQNFVSFIQITISNEFWKRLTDCWKINPSFKKYCTDPNNVIDLYNDAINRLCNIAEEDFYEYIDFPEELIQFVPECNLDIPCGIEYFPKDWKTKRRSLNIGNFLRKIKLKKWNATSINDIKTLEKEIINYCQFNLNNTIVSESQSNPIVGYSAIKAMLDDINKTENQYYFTFKEKLENMTWLNICEAITFEILNISYKIEKNSLPNEIIYNKDKLNNYLEIPWWLNYKKMKEIKFSKFNNLKNLSENQNDKVLLEPILEKANKLIEKANRNLVNYQNMQQNEITKSIDLSLYNFKKMEIDSKLNITDEVFNSSFIYENTRKKRTNKEMYNSENDDTNSVIAKAMRILEKVEKRYDMKK